MSYSPLYFDPIGKGSARQTITGYQNGTGSTLAALTPVATNSSGQIVLIDVSNIASVLSLVGLVLVDIPSAANGSVVDNGRLENITTGLAVGSPVYLSKAGFIQTASPVAGSDGFVTGDSVVFIGIIVQNEFDNTKKDLKLLIERIGIL